MKKRRRPKGLREEEPDETSPSEEVGVVYLIGSEESLDPAEPAAAAEAARERRPRPLRLNILRDAGPWVVADKPAGLSTTRERWKPDADTALSLLHALDRARDPDAPLPRPVHRLDRETSGAVLFARGAEAAASLSAAFRRRNVGKDYLALVVGTPLEEKGVIDLRLSADPGPGRPVKVVRHGGRPSRTEWQVEETFRGHTLVRVVPRSGRTHQVRVTMAHIGCPLVGDVLYNGGQGLYLSALKPRYRPPADGPERPLIGRVALHARSLTFPDPEAPDPGSAPPVTVEAPLPRDFAAALKQLRRWRGA